MVAVGGYGRAELAPGSDLDVTVVYAEGGEKHARAAVEAVLYPLWDAKVVVSHAVRTPEQCAGQARKDLAALTAWLDARLVTGSPELFEAANQRVLGLIGDPRRFEERVWAWRLRRDRRYSRLADQLEPNLKESLGGLRDLHTMRWLVRAGELAGWEWPDRLEDVVSFLSASRPEEWDLLLRARTALHLASGSAADVLTVDHHASVAKLLGMADEGPWEARDALVRDLARAGRWVDFVGSFAIGSAHRSRPSSSLPVGLHPDEPERQAATVLGAFAAPVEEVPSATWWGDPTPLRRGFERSAPVPWPPRWLESLCSAVAAPAGGRSLEQMEAIGLLSFLVPEWELVAGRPQRDPYHRFPVDVHLVATAAEAARLLREPDEAFAIEAVASVGDPQALLLGALLHDIGKTGAGGHVPAGVEVARTVLDRMGVTGERREDVLFLVGEHLLLSDTATRRNLDDEDLILHVSARIGEQRRLAMLYLLTLADAAATGPSACSPWRMTLVRDLVAKVSHVFARGSMDRVTADRLAQIEARLRRELRDLPPQDVDAFLDAVPTAYLQTVRPSEAPIHLRLVVPAPGEDEVRTSVRPGRSSETNVVAVAARDRLGLLASVAGAMTLSGLSILTAQVFTTEHGVALDLFEVRSTFETRIPPERWARFERSLADNLRGHLDLAKKVAALRAHYRPAAPGVPVSVELHQDASDFFTVAEVGGPDRLGLLFDLTSALARHRFDVHTAKVATYGPRVVDVFYVTEADGEKVARADRLGELERALREAALPR